MIIGKRMKGRRKEREDGKKRRDGRMKENEKGGKISQTK